MGDFQISYFLYFPKFIYCLFAFHGALSPSHSGISCEQSQLAQ